MANPFEYGDQPKRGRGVSEESANDRMEEEFKRRLDNNDGEREDQRDPEPVELDDGGAFSVDTEPQRATRQEKKQDRYKQATERADAAEERMRRLEVDIAAERAAARYQPQAPQQPVRDHVEDAIEANYRDRENITSEFNTLHTAGTLTDEKRNSLISRQKAAERKGQELVWQQMDRRKQANRDPAEDTMNQLTGRYPDVTSNKQAFAWADGETRKRRALGETFDHDLVDSVMEETRKQFKLGKYKNGVPNEQAYASPGKGGGGGGRSEGKIKMTSGMRSLADASFPHIENDRERWRAWAKTAGKSLLAREAKEGR